MKKYNLIYIDDNIDNDITAYLRGFSANYDIEYSEREFKTNETYSDLLKDPVVLSANIVLIDSRLFENRNVLGKKFTGEEFKILLNKIFPFKKVFVISQNDDEKGIGFIKKANLDDDSKIKKYYDEKLQPVVLDAMQKIEVEMSLVDEMLDKKIMDTVILDQIKNSLDGIEKFDTLTSTDIDKVIERFNKLKLE